MTTGFIVFCIAAVILIISVRGYEKKQKRGADAKFPAAAKELLLANVPFYHQLDDAGRQAFEERTKDFLFHTAITGVGGVIVSDLDKMLVASAAIIPIFSFPDWRYNNINEVLLYNGAFDHEYQQGEGRNIIGMVGDGAMQRQMILSQPALRSSFQGSEDGHNTAIHEFAHLLDKADGAVDGIPEYLLAKPYIIPWVKHMRETIAEMKTHEHSDIDLYGATNDAEFFAVVSEYFFEKPEKLKEQHPEIYNFLEKMFKPQDSK